MHAAFAGGYEGRDAEAERLREWAMGLLDVLERTRLVSLDEQLRKLAETLRLVRGEYAEEARTLERIDALLDERLRFGREVDLVE
ncbi:MAG: hypothetical protein J2P24_08140 [Streptosporangiales bacterium]|nr:hypothetical protein [Streptosporangiales bacterium]